MKLLVPSGAPLHDRCGEVLPFAGDLVVLERLAVGDVVAADVEGVHGREQVVGVRADGTVEAHRDNVVRRLVPPHGPRGGSGTHGRMDAYPPYPSGLRLAGRRVVMVGAGHVAQRRVPALLASGAVVTVVSPEATPAIEALADAGEIALGAAPVRGRATSTTTWYVVAATDDHAANEAVSAAAEARRIFCVRADDAMAASAWTPAVGRSSGVTVAVLSTSGQPRPATLRGRPRRDPRGTA